VFRFAEPTIRRNAMSTTTSPAMRVKSAPPSHTRLATRNQFQKVLMYLKVEKIKYEGCFSSLSIYIQQNK
jgi:hypothetical protein